MKKMNLKKMSLAFTLAIVMFMAAPFLTLRAEDTATAANTEVVSGENNSVVSEATGTIVTDEPATVVSSDPSDPASSVMDYFFSYAGLVLLTQIITGWLLRLPFTSKMNSDWKQVCSWAITFIICYYGQYKGLGVLADASLEFTAAIATGVAMVANNFYDAGTLDKILYLLKAKKRPTA